LEALIDVVKRKIPAKLAMSSNIMAAIISPRALLFSSIRVSSIDLNKKRWDI
jgi:hypothetical protein